MDIPEPVEIDPSTVGVFLTPEQRKGVYSNAAQLSATQDEITLNFLYINPSDEPQATLVSRIMMTREKVKSLVTALQDAEKQIAAAEKKLKGDK